jgi:hypothetical protein
MYSSSPCCSAGSHAADLTERVPDREAIDMADALQRCRRHLGSKPIGGSFAIPSSWPAVTSGTVKTDAETQNFMRHAGPTPDQQEWRTVVTWWSTPERLESLNEVIDVVGWGEFTIGWAGRRHHTGLRWSPPRRPAERSSIHRALGGVEREQRRRFEAHAPGRPSLTAARCDAKPQRNIIGAAKVSSWDEVKVRAHTHQQRYAAAVMPPQTGPPQAVSRSSYRS